MDWPALQQLPLVVLAVAEETRLVRIEVKMEKMRIEANNTRKIFNRYLDTNSDDEEVDELEVDNREYGDFIRASVAVGTRVARRYQQFNWLKPLCTLKLFASGTPIPSRRASLKRCRTRWPWWPGTPP